MKISTDIVTCYVVRRSSTGDQFLQLRRVPDDYLGGTWQAISGRIESGETAWRAALREVREEAGIVPIEFYRLPLVNTFYIYETDTLFHAVPFCAIVHRDVTIRLNDEHDAWRWIDVNQIDDSFMWATDRSALAELRRTILDDGPAKPYLRIPLPPNRPTDRPPDPT